MQLENRVAIVTGSSSGLGRAIATTLSKRGARIVCSDLHSAGLQASTGEQATHDVIAKAGGEAIFIKTDVSDSESVQSLVRSTVHAYGRLDIMVNNAGVSAEAKQLMPIYEAPEDRFDSTMKVNARGTFLGCKYAAIQMMKQEFGASKDRGWIVNISSALAVIAMQGSPYYSASKGAVSSLTRAVAMDLAPYRIHCNAVLPGFMNTPMISELKSNVETREALIAIQPFQRLGDPMEIANTVAFLCSEEASGISGVNLSVDTGLVAQLKV